MNGAPALEIHLLGRANVIAAGEPAKFAKRATTLALVALLILQRGKPVARSFLAYALFPDDDEERALAELRRYLYLTTKALPPRVEQPWLIVDAETVRWNEAAGAFVDVLEFERLASDPATHAEAVALYTGDLLEDVYEDWVVAGRERLRSTYMHVLAGLVERHRASREHAAALAYAQLLLAVDPWREDVVRQVMSIRYASGDSASALVEYDRFAVRLRDEMTMLPMPETSALREAIVRNEPVPGSVEANAAPAGGADARRSGTVLPFVGRKDECTRMLMRWDRAARGFGGVLVVCGEAGVGKTRLVGEIARAAEKQGGRVFSGTTSASEAIPYQCVVQAFRSAQSVIAARAPDAMTLRVLARVLPELTEPSGADIDVLAPESEAARLFDAMAKLAVHLASPRPLLLIFEDLHWASASTIDAIAAIARRIDRARVLILATYREEEAGAAHALRRLIDALGMEQRITSVHLERFDRALVLDVVAHIEDLAKRDDALAERLYTLSEGNALFLHEAIAHELESGGERENETLQPGIGNVIAARTARLSEDARTIAEIAAVCGQGCSFDVVRDVSGMQAARVLDALDELLDRHLVREAGARERFDYVFTHHLIGSSIYERIEPARRARRHARVAHVLEQRADGGPEIVRALGRHYDRAGLADRASRWYGLAARDAAALYANDDAVDFATLALAHEPDPAVRIEALFVREEANARRGRRDRQLLDLEELERIVADPDLRCRVLHRRVLLFNDIDDRRAEHEAVSALLEAAESLGDERWKGIAASAQARMFIALSRYGEASNAARAALGHLKDSGMMRERIGAYMTLIDACVVTGERFQVEPLLAAAREIAREAGDRAAIAQTLLHAVGAAVYEQRFDHAAALAEEAIPHYRAIGDRVGEARALVSVATASVRLSRFREARAANVAAVQTFEEIGDRAGLARTLMNLGMLHGGCGDFERAAEHFSAARGHLVRLGDERGRTAALLNESFIALWQNRADEAKTLAQGALDAATGIGHAAFRAQALANLGAAERDLGNFETALAHMESGLRIQLELGRMSNAVSDLADAALTYVRKGDFASARRSAERALDADPSFTQAAIFPPYPPWICACVLHWTNDSRAAGVLSQASDLAQSFCASIDDPELRARFEALPFLAAIEEARAGRWPVLDAPAARQPAAIPHG